MAAAPASLSKPKVTYFNYDGGRGEVIRLALVIAGVEFIDERVDFPTWPQKKPFTPYGSLPLFEWDGHVLAQSNAILRFIGRKYDMYPTELYSASLADELMDAVEDIASKFQPTMQIPAGPERLAKRKEIAEGPLAHFLKHFDEVHKKATAAHPGSKFYFGEKLTVADLKLWGLLRWLASGTLDGIDGAILTAYPSLLIFKEAVSSLPKVVDWLEKRKAALAAVPRP